MKNNQLVDLFGSVGVLKNVKRYGWVLKGIEEAESISDHAFRVTFMVMILAESKKLDKEKLINMALIHDLGKSLVGDIIYERGKKAIAPLKHKYEDEKRAFEKAIKNIKNKKYFIELWDERVELKTKESKFLRSIEKLEMVMTALEYEAKGYKKALFDEYWANAKMYLKDKEFIKLFKELEKRRKKLK